MVISAELESEVSQLLVTAGEKLVAVVQQVMSLLEKNKHVQKLRVANITPIHACIQFSHNYRSHAPTSEGGAKTIQVEWPRRGVFCHPGTGASGVDSVGQHHQTGRERGVA